MNTDQDIARRCAPLVILNFLALVLLGMLSGCLCLDGDDGSPGPGTGGGVDGPTATGGAPGGTPGSGGMAGPPSSPGPTGSGGAGAGGAPASAVCAVRCIADGAYCFCTTNPAECPQQYRVVCPDGAAGDCTCVVGAETFHTIPGAACTPSLLTEPAACNFPLVVPQ